MFQEKLLDHKSLDRLTPGQQWRFKRNCVIYVSSKNGFSQRLLADVFALPRSRIAAIVQEFRQYDPEFEGP